MATKNDDIAVIFLFVLIGSLMLLLSIYVIPTIFALARLALAFWMFVIAVGGFAFYIARVSIFFGAGLIILSFAFMSSVILGTGTLGEYWRVVIIVESNPSYHVNLASRVFLFAILPLTMGLALCIFTYMKERRIPTGSFGGLFSLVLGGFFIFWGINYFQAAYGEYFRAIEIAREENVSYINNSLQAVYTTYGLIGILWLIIGIFLTAISAYTLYMLRRQHENSFSKESQRGSILGYATFHFKIAFKATSYKKALTINTRTLCLRLISSTQF